jgi:hypothetical protein
MKDYPCKGCEKRYMGCHSKCEDYAKMLEETKAKREAIQEEQRIKRIADDYSIGVIAKCKAKQHRKRR